MKRRRLDEWGPTIYTYEYESRALRKTKRFTVCFPADYEESGHRYPLAVVLHGMGRNHLTVVGSEKLRREMAGHSIVFVFPDGENGCYIDSPVRPESRYQAYLQEVIDFAGSALRIREGAEARAIVGWSMGGFGAAHYLVTHPGAFGTFASIIGLLDYPNPAAYGEARHFPVQAVFPDKEEAWRPYRAAERVEAFDGVNMMQYVGASAFDYAMNAHFHKQLETAGIPHEYIEEQGGHEWGTVERALPVAWAFCSKQFGLS